MPRHAQEHGARRNEKALGYRENSGDQASGSGLSDPDTVVREPMMKTCARQSRRESTSYTSIRNFALRGETVWNEVWLEHPYEVVPYKILPPVVDSVKQVVSSRLRLFNGVNGTSLGEVSANLLRGSSNTDLRRPKKKRGDCSPLSFSHETKQLPSVLPFHRDKPTASSLAKSGPWFAWRYSVKRCLTGAFPAYHWSGPRVSARCRTIPNFVEAVLFVRALCGSSSLRSPRSQRFERLNCFGTAVVTLRGQDVNHTAAIFRCGNSRKCGNLPLAPSRESVKRAQYLVVGHQFPITRFMDIGFNQLVLRPVLRQGWTMRSRRIARARRAKK